MAAALTSVSGFREERPYVPLSELSCTVGPDFVRTAVQLLGEGHAQLAAQAAAEKQRAVKQQLKQQMDESLAHMLDSLYYQALYDGSFCLTLENKGRSYYVQTVPGHLWDDPSSCGPNCQAEVMVVGKQPSYDEGLFGRNFVGAAGQQLRQMLETMGFEPGNWYMTNVVRFPPPSRSGDTTVAASWIADCAPLLQQEIALVRPKYILCLGAEAIRTVLGRGATLTSTARRAMEIQVTLPDGELHTVKVVTCLHPSALKHAPEKHDDLVQGLEFFRDVLYGEGSEALTDPEKDRQHMVIHTLEHLRLVAAWLKENNFREYAIDCEWDGEPGEPDHYLRTIQFSWGWKQAALIPLTTVGGVRYFDGTDDQVREILEGLWRPQHVRIIGHFLNEDAKALFAYGLDWFWEKLWAPVDDLVVAPGCMPRMGWEKTADEGPWDTGLGGHANNETMKYDLQLMGLRFTTCGNYSAELEDYKKAWCKKNKVKLEDITGYGFVPDEILWKYALYDACVTWRLFYLQNRPGGLVDCDSFGFCSRESYWIALRAMPAFLQASLCGIEIDTERAELLRQDYNATRDDLLADLRRQLNWPDFNPNSTPHCREMLFGEEYNRNFNQETGEYKRIRPDSAISLRLEPYKSTGKRAKLWSQIRQRKQEDDYDPACDKETLTVLGIDCKPAALLKDIRFVSQVTRSVLHDPREKKGEIVFDEDGNPVFDKGILYWVQHDGRVRTHFSQVKETSRASSWSPPTQNLGKKREKDYMRILGKRYRWPIRSIFRASPGRVLIEADYKAAEVCAAAWMSGDTLLMEHARRTCLPEDHPDYFDIHSYIAVKTFNLSCEPTKAALKAAGYSSYRDAAKTRFFGWFYGQGDLAAWRKVREEVEGVTLQQIEALTVELRATYPRLAAFFASAYSRVVDPGFVCGAYGTRRRFAQAGDDASRADQERECANFLIQNLVAKAVETAMANVLDYQRLNLQYDFKICMQIHDALVFDAAIKDAAHVHNYVIPSCMSHQVPIVPCDMDGMPLQTGPFYFGVDRSLSLRWGEKLPEEFAKRYNLTKEYLV